MDELYDYLNRKVPSEARALGGLMQPMRSGSVAGTVYLTQYETDRQKQVRVTTDAALKASARGDAEGAERLWTEVVALDPSHEGAFAQLAAFREVRARERAAREEAERAHAVERARQERILFDLIRVQGLTYDEYDRAVDLLHEFRDALGESDLRRRDVLDALVGAKLKVKAYRSAMAALEEREREGEEEEEESDGTTGAFVDAPKALPTPPLPTPPLPAAPPPRPAGGLPHIEAQGEKSKTPDAVQNSAAATPTSKPAHGAEGQDDGVRRAIEHLEQALQKPGTEPPSETNPSPRPRRGEPLLHVPSGSSVPVPAEDAESARWARLARRVQLGDRVSATVRAIAPSGATLEMEEGVYGILSAEDLSWNAFECVPSDLLRIGQEVDVVVRALDAPARALSLGMKQKVEDPWRAAGLLLPRGSTVQGRYLRTVEDGHFFDVGAGLVALAPFRGQPAREDLATWGSVGTELRVIEVDAGRRVLRVEFVPAIDSPPEPSLLRSTHLHSALALRVLSTFVTGGMVVPIVQALVLTDGGLTTNEVTMLLAYSGAWVLFFTIVAAYLLRLSLHHRIREGAVLAFAVPLAYATGWIGWGGQLLAAAEGTACALLLLGTLQREGRERATGPSELFDFLTGPAATRVGWLVLFLFALASILALVRIWPADDMDTTGAVLRILPLMALGAGLFLVGLRRRVGGAVVSGTSVLLLPAMLFTEFFDAPEFARTRLLPTVIWVILLGGWSMLQLQRRARDRRPKT